MGQCFTRFEEHFQIFFFIFFTFLASIRHAFRYHLPVTDPKYHLKRPDYAEVFRERFDLGKELHAAAAAEEIR